MKELLVLLRGAKKIAQALCPEGEVVHYLLPTGEVLELVSKA